jgi:hypothetical protein
MEIRLESLWSVASCGWRTFFANHPPSFTRPHGLSRALFLALALALSISATLSATFSRVRALSRTCAIVVSFDEPTDICLVDCVPHLHLSLHRDA